MGVSGSGKSTAGVALAHELGMPYADGDDFHPAASIATMRAGHPLSDADRYPWLDAVGGWLGRYRGVVSCSALRRSYRDRLRLHCPDLNVLHLRGSFELIEERMNARSGHFMPTALLRSQFATLEPLDPDERGVTADVGQPVESIVRQYLSWAATL